MDFMSEAVQRKLADYAEAGGHLVVLPGLPSVNERGDPCTVLLDAAMPAGERPSFPAVSALASGPMLSIVRCAGGEVIAANGPTAVLPAGAGCEVLARDGDTGTPCAVSYPVSDGMITVLGFRLQYAANEATDHQSFLVSLVENTVGPRTAWSTNPRLTAMQLSGPDGGLLCVVNPTPLPATTSLYWSPGDSGTAHRGDAVRRALPSQLDGIPFTGIGARLLPLRRRLRHGGELFYATWELLADGDADAGSALVFDTPGGGDGEVALTGDVTVLGVLGGELLRTVVADRVAVAVISSTGAEVTVHVGRTTG
jgi:hypothetical protein